MKKLFFIGCVFLSLFLVGCAPIGKVFEALVATQVDGPESPPGNYCGKPPTTVCPGDKLKIEPSTITFGSTETTKTITVTGKDTFVFPKIFFCKTPCNLNAENKINQWVEAGVFDGTPVIGTFLSGANGISKQLTLNRDDLMKGNNFILIYTCQGLGLCNDRKWVLQKFTVTFEQATCTDGIKNGAETDIDCGGSCTTKCAVDKGCTGDTDCASTKCDATTKKCVVVCVPPPTNLISWYSGDGHANDLIRGTTAVVQGATFDTGKVGQAFKFDGVANEIVVPNAPELNFAATSPLTVDAWVFRTGTESIMHILGKRDGCSSSINYQLAFDPTNGLHLGSSGGTAATNIQVPLNTWTHVAATSDGSTLKFYINGELKATAAGNLGAPVTGDVKIGASGTCGNRWHGLIDEVEIFNRALSATEIKAIFDASSFGKCKSVCIPPPANLISWYPGDGNTNDIADGNHGIINEAGTTFVQGKVGQAFQFDGSMGHISIGNPANLKMTQGITIDAWINPTLLPSTGALKSIVTKWGQRTATDATSDSYGLWLLNSGGQGMLFSAINQGGVQRSVQGGTIPLNVFSHVAMTFDATSGAYKLYLNGAEVASATVPGPLFASDKNVAIGREDSSAPRPFKGIIDEVELFNRALSPTEVKAIFDAGFAGKCKQQCSPACTAPKKCDQSIRQCVDCFTNTDCSGKLCDPSSRTCVQCVTDGNCQSSPNTIEDSITASEGASTNPGPKTYVIGGKNYVVLSLTSLANYDTTALFSINGKATPRLTAGQTTRIEDILFGLRTLSFYFEGEQNFRAYISDYFLASKPKCDSTTKTCVSCLADTDCSSGNKCNPATKTCVSCLADTDCPTGNQCINAQCIIPTVCTGKADGSSCSTCTGCLPGTCQASVCTTTISNTQSLGTAVSVTHDISLQARDIAVESAAALRVGDEILIHQTRSGAASAVGNYEYNKILNIIGNSLVLATPVTKAYTLSGNDRIQVVRVDPYEKMIVAAGGVVTAASWDGNKGGILALTFKTIYGLEVLSGGKIDMSEKGFRRGDGRCGLGSNVGLAGESYQGIPGQQCTANAGGGGGGDGVTNSGSQLIPSSGYTTAAASGGGGGYGAVGQAGQNGVGHACGGSGGGGGLTYGVADLSRINLGSGGGAGGGNQGWQGRCGAGGGFGGGIVILTGGIIKGSGIIAANGQNGNPSSAGTGGGGGAGGSILLTSFFVSLPSSNIQIAGGSGGSGGRPGGGGGVGIKRVRTTILTSTPTETPTPTPSLCDQLQCASFVKSTCPAGCKTRCISSFCNPESHICTADCADKPGSCACP